MPYVPSFGERLTPILNDALAKIGEGFKQGAARKRIEAYFGGQQNQPSGQPGAEGQTSTTPGSPVSGISPIQNAQFFEDFKTAYGTDVAKIASDAMLAQQKAQSKEAAEIRKEQRAEQKELREKSAVREELVPVSKAINELIDKAAYGAGGLGASAELDSSGFWYTDKVYTHFNKGVVSNDRFETMKKELAPNSNLPPSVNRARLASLNRMAGLPSDISSKKFDSTMDAEIKKVKKAEVHAAKVDEKKGKSSPITDEIAAQIFAEAGQDPAKAREIAKKRGYEF